MKTTNQIIENHPFFRGMDAAHIALLEKGARVVEFKANALMFREAAPADHFFLILSGKVSVETAAAKAPAPPVLVQELGPGEVLGWSWLFPPFHWHFQARALEETHVIQLAGAHLLVAAEQDHQFGFELMKRVAQVVIQRLQATRRQLLAPK